MASDVSITKYSIAKNSNAYIADSNTSIHGSIFTYSYFTPTTAVLGNCVGSGGVHHRMFHLFPGTVDHIAH